MIWFILIITIILHIINVVNLIGANYLKSERICIRLKCKYLVIIYSVTRNMHNVDLVHKHKTLFYLNLVHANTFYSNIIFIIVKVSLFSYALYSAGFFLYSYFF